MLPNPETREVTIVDYLKIFQKRISLIVSILFIIPAVVTIFVFTQKPIYRATTSIVIEKSAPRVTRFEEVYQAESDLQYYQTQYKILSSRSLAEKAFEELHLSKDSEFSKIKDPVGKLQDQVSIEPLKNSQIVMINVEDVDALRASSIANAYAKAYIQQDIERRNIAAKEAVGFLDDQLSDVKKKLQESEEALNKYIQDNKIVTIPDVEKKTETLLENLKQERSKTETEIAELVRRYKEKHPKMIALKAHLEEVNRKIEQETDNLLKLTQKMVKYNLLKQDVDSNKQLYVNILTRTKETSVTEKLEVSRIRVVDYARPPEFPFKPKKGQSILMSIIFSLFLGIGISFLMEYLDATIRTADDVTTYLSLPFLGYIPSIGKDAKTEIERSLICFQKPKSSTAESYRAIRTSLLFASPGDKPLKSILITSALPQEGKSFFTANLATIFSQVNERIILLDIDMRRPKIHKSFNIEQKPGLSNFLTGGVDLADVIKATPIPNLSLITSGTIPPNPSELLTSAKIRLLFEELKSKFDRVIIDSPPILSVADTSLLTNIADGVVLLIKGGSTRIEAIVRSKQKLLEAKGRIIGVVVNNIEPEKEDRYYYYHYYYSEEAKPEQA